MADETKKGIKQRDITVGEAKVFLDKIFKTDIVPFLWGPPGVGKSSIVKEIAKDNGWQIIDLRLSLLNPVDLRGLPTINHEKGEAKWLAPGFLPKEDTKETGILFLDEINLAPLSVQAAAYQLILDKQVGDYRFPKHWKMVAAGNRETDKANVFKISAPLANRFVHLTIRPEFYQWKAWAEKSSIHPNVIHFLTLRTPAIFDPPSDQEKAFPSPRSWEFVSKMLDVFDYNEEDDVPEELALAVYGCIGEGTGRELVEHLNTNKLKLLTKKVEDFIKTGKLSMPRLTSERLTFIASVFEAYASGKIDQVKYDNFRSHLAAEEKKTLEDFEERNAAKIAKKFKNVTRVPQGDKTTITTEFIKDSTLLWVADTAKFNSQGTLLIIHPDGKQQNIVSYASKTKDAFGDLQRSSTGADIIFPVGSEVNKLA